MKDHLKRYLAERPLFLSLIRTKEAWLFQKYLPLKEPVLDVGCGDGFFAKTTFGHLTVGLDVENSRINEVEPGVYEKLVKYDGRKIPLESGAMQTVVSNCVLEHLANLDEVLWEINRVLQPGGVFLTTVMAKPWDENLFFPTQRYKKWMRKRQRHFNLLNLWEWEVKLKEAGFKVKEKIGYLTPEAGKLIDLSHYLSIPSLLTKILFGRWAVGPVWRLLPINYLVKIMEKNEKLDKSGAIFFVCQRL